MVSNDCLNEYSWVMRVLDSCRNDEQIASAQKLFELYVKKWNSNVEKSKITLLSTNFEKEKKSKLVTMNKKGKSSLFGRTQIYLF